MASPLHRGNGRPSLDMLMGTRSGREGSSTHEEDTPDLTLRAVVAGLAIGVLLALTNMYFGLQTGWISMMSLQASLLGFAVFKVLPKSPFFSNRPLTLHENIVLQTTAVATGTLPLAAGFVGILPALAQLRPETDNSPPLVLSWQSLLAWSFGVAFFGVFLAVPLRRQVIVKEKLVFPSGTATASVIGVLHGRPLISANVEGESETEAGLRRRRRATAPLEEVAEEEEAMLRRVRDEDLDEDDLEELGGNVSRAYETEQVVDRKSWWMLMVSFAVSAGYTLLSNALPVIYAIPVFDIFVRGAAHDWLWWMSPSFSYIGQGIIMGFPTVLSMNLGMLAGWLFLSPLSHNLGWAPGPVASTTDGARGWILWPALAIMTAESILSVSLVAADVAKPYLSRAKTGALFVSAERHYDSDEESDADEGEQLRRRMLSSPAEDEPSTRAVLLGMAVSCVACIVLVAAVFGDEGIKWWATVVALILASIFAILGVRALGTTDLNPVSAIGKISQLVFALIQPGNVVANLVAGGIAEAGAQQSGDLMQDLKTGYLWGASPRAQFQGQLIGSFASVFVSTGVYCLYRRVYELPSTSFPVPTAAIWLNLARLVNQGKLPPYSKEAMLIFGAVFVVFASLKAVGKVLAEKGEEERRKWAWTGWIPSGIAFSIGFLNTPSFSLARLIGGVISLYYTSRRPSSSSSSSTGAAHLEHFGLVIVASGFVLGEGLASVVGLLLKSVGTGGPVSCWGCGVGGGGYCGGCP
ncbi:hypothetical protein JCM11251_003813 [Rhodosporidiobolus azoricus]